MPPALVEGVDISHLEPEDFLDLLAKARYIQEVEAAIIQQGVANAFGGEE